MKKGDSQQLHRQHMASMNSMFSSPFFSGGGLGGGVGMNPFMPAVEDGSRRRQHTDREAGGGRRSANQDPFAMSPFGMMGGGGMFGGGLFGNMHSMMGNMQQNFERMSNDPNTHSYSSTSVMSYSNTGDGAPKVYQASSSTRQTPGGVKETRKTVRDSETGTHKMAIGHHLGDRAHVMERKRNTRTGDQEENQEFVNLDESEAESFNREFRNHTNRYQPGQQTPLTGPVRHTRREYPAITDSRREHRDSRAGASYQRDRNPSYQQEHTPTRPTGPGPRGRQTHDRREAKERGHHSKPHDKKNKPDKSVSF